MNRFMLKVAVHLFLIHNGQVLLLRRFNTGYEDGNYSVPAGHLDGGESVTQAMIREAQEECGIAVQPRDLSVDLVMHRKTDGGEWIDFFLTAACWSGEITNREPHKCDDLRWFLLHELPDNIIPYIQDALRTLQLDVQFCEFGWDDQNSISRDNT